MSKCKNCVYWKHAKGIWGKCKKESKLYTTCHSNCSSGNYKMSIGVYIKCWIKKLKRYVQIIKNSI